MLGGLSPVVIEKQSLSISSLMSLHRSAEKGSVPWVAKSDTKELLN